MVGQARHYVCAYKGSGPYSITCKRSAPARKLTFRMDYKNLVIPPGPSPALPSANAGG